MCPQILPFPEKELVRIQKNNGTLKMIGQELILFSLDLTSFNTPLAARAKQLIRQLDRIDFTADPFEIPLFLKSRITEEFITEWEKSVEKAEKFHTTGRVLNQIRFILLDNIRVLESSETPFKMISDLISIVANHRDEYLELLNPYLWQLHALYHPLAEFADTLKNHPGMSDDEKQEAAKTPRHMIVWLYEVFPTVIQS